MRIEINLTEEVATALQAKAEALNHSRKSYIEFLCIKEALLKKMSKEKPRQIEAGEWIYKGCFIQESEHPQLLGKYEVFKNDEPQTHVGRCYTFAEAKKLCKENECFENVLSL